MSTLSEYRPVAESEIRVLISNGCTCDYWGNISVKENFNPAKLRNVHFSGKNSLGLLTDSFSDESGVTIDAEIVNARIHNCNIGNNVAIRNVHGHLANYIIEDNVRITDCGRITTAGLTAFGNGTVVAVLTETGARSVKIWDRLTSHLAYILTLHRYRTNTLDRIEEITGKYVEGVSSSTGRIGRNSEISGCNEIHNVNIGPFTKISGASRLNEGSINSSPEDPVFIGSDVIMDHFIVCSGSAVEDAAIIDRCFIGQGCTLGKQFSAENSLFFANCEFFHGEACSVFAGPYTVSHHKNTLLIAGMFSFMNAGSGSNQSNHKYKLGPVHQGIVERGAKTASDSYLLWPSHIGAFTIVAGRHEKSIDSSSFPFSYLIESDNTSILVPGINLRSSGIFRDERKWPARDGRRDALKLDLINFNLLNPRIARKMIAGKKLLKKLLAESEPHGEFFSFGNLKITMKSLERGIQLYRNGTEGYIGGLLMRRLENASFTTIAELREQLAYDRFGGTGEWIDMAGLIAPLKETEELMSRIDSAEISTPDSLEEAFEVLHRCYDKLSWSWAATEIEKEVGQSFDNITAADLIRIVERWDKSLTGLGNLIIEDAGREFDLTSLTGFGMDGTAEQRLLDFELVRGNFESNEVVNEIRSHISSTSAMAENVIEKLRGIK